MATRVIYSNYFWEEDENGKNKYDYAREYLFENYAEEEGWKKLEEVPQNRIESEVNFEDEDEWEKAEIQLSTFVKESNTLLLTGVIGTWQGQFRGGFFFDTLEELFKAWEDCDYVEIYEENGHLYVNCSHHDGNNDYEIKELTNKGSEYRDNHEWDMDERELHTKLWNSNFFTKLPRFSQKVENI